MGAKIIQVSDDAGVTWHTLPGNTGTMSLESGQIKDTVFGQNYESNEAGLISSKVDAQAFYKGFAGYKAKILKSGAATAFAAEAMTLVSGKTYKITDPTKNVWDRAVAVVVKDGGIDHTTDVETIDFLFGRVTFKAAYSPAGAITADGSYLPMTALGKAHEVKMTQTAAVIDETDFGTAQSNSGYTICDYGLQTVKIDLTGFYDVSSALRAQLTSRSELIIEINPDGNSKSLARGFFRCVSEAQSGDVGALEQETTSFDLNVPTSPSNLEKAFGWIHESDTTIPTALQKILDAWTGLTKLAVQYLYDGTNGSKWASAIVTDVSMTTSLTGMNEFTANFQGDGAPTDVGTG